MAYQPDPALINPALLRALQACERPLTPEEASLLRQELSSDPEGAGYKADGGGYRPAHELAALLNLSGRCRAVLGDLIAETGDVVQALSSPNPPPAGPTVPPAGPTAHPAAKPPQAQDKAPV